MTSRVSNSLHCHHDHSLPCEKDPAPRVTNRISSLGIHVQKAISSVKLIFKSALALILGVIPFAASKIGYIIVKGSAYLAQTIEDLSIRLLGTLGLILSIVLRAIIGIPAVTGGILLFGGAAVFSKSQALIWGQESVEHPQEEKATTSLARYGASGKLFSDFEDLSIAFFHPLGNAPSEELIEGTDSDGEPAYDARFIEGGLSKWQKFQIGNAPSDETILNAGC